MGSLGGTQMEREPIDWRNRSPRRKVSLAGMAFREDGGSFRVLITNLSYHGCHVISDQEFGIGETVKLQISGQGVVNGQVRWVRDGSAGVRFLIEHITSAAEQRRARLGV